jgi:hypothetical protein
VFLASPRAANWTPQLTWLGASANDPSPAVWWCTRARSRASATASWATRRRTATTSSRGDHHVINRRMPMGDAMMNRPIIARRETVLRHRGRNSTRKQRSHKRESFQDGHDYPPKPPSLTCSFRIPTRSPVYDGLVCSVIIAPCAPVDPAPGVPFKRPKCGAMSGSGTKRTCQARSAMSALGVKRTSVGISGMSAYDRYS